MGPLDGGRERGLYMQHACVHEINMAEFRPNGARISAIRGLDQRRGSDGWSFNICGPGPATVGRKRQEYFFASKKNEKFEAKIFEAKKLS